MAVYQADEVMNLALFKIPFKGLAVRFKPVGYLLKRAVFNIDFNIGVALGFSHGSDQVA